MKMLNKVENTAFIIVMVLLVTSCSGKPVKFDQPLSAMPGQKYDMGHGRTGTSEACGFQLFRFFPIMTNQRAAIAYDKLKSKAGNGYLTDIRVQETWTYAFVGTLYCTVMEGTVYPPIQS